MRIAIINGPNLNLLGKREPEIYGTQDFLTYLAQLKNLFPKAELSYFQSNLEGELIKSLQDMAIANDAIIYNGAGYTHTSIALGDAVAALAVPVIEVHVSNIHARERFRLHSYSAKHAAGVITGFGLDGYRMAIDSLLNNEYKN